MPFLIHMTLRECLRCTDEKDHILHWTDLITRPHYPTQTQQQTQLTVRLFCSFGNASPPEYSMNSVIKAIYIHPRQVSNHITELTIRGLDLSMTVLETDSTRPMPHLIHMTLRMRTQHMQLGIELNMHLKMI